MPKPLLLAAALLVTGCAGPAEDPLAYVVFFPAPSSEPDLAGQAVLDQAARAAAAATSRVTVSGYADRAGTPQANQIQSRLRTQAVADGLLARGIAKARIHIRHISSLGGDPGIESRRVEITIPR